MTGKLHETLAAEKTPTAAYNQLHEETLKKFSNTATYFDGHTKTLKMLEESPPNAALEAQAREEKPVVTNVADTLGYLFEIFGRSENLQYQKNATNQIATGTVMFKDKPLLPDMPVDQLLGLEARLAKIRQLFVSMPTLDASKEWKPAKQGERGIWETVHAEETTKTEKVMTPVIMAPATDKHPAQVQAVNKDVVVGKYTTIKRSGAVTALQKAETIKNIDDLLVEVKKARMRANETEVVSKDIASTLIGVLLAPLKK